MNKSREFANLIQEGSVGVNIAKSPWGTEVSVSDNRGESKYAFSKEQLEQINNFLSEYKEIIIEIDNIRKEYDGVDLAWHIGEIAERYIDGEDITNGDFALITNVGSSGDGTYTGQMRNIYNIFPNKEYHTEHFNKSTICELTQTVDEYSLKNINSNANEYNINVRKPRLRAIRDVYNSDDGVSNSVEKALDRKLFKNMDSDELTDVIYDAHLLLGDESASKSEIKNLILE
jgi:hypothetical protein